MDRALRYSAHPSRRSRLAMLALAVALAAALAVALAGLGSRFDLWHFRTGFTVLRWGAYASIAAAVLSFLGIVAARAGGRRGAGYAVLGLALSLVVVGTLWGWKRRAAAVPAIHDITTDTVNPPEFVAVLPLRADAPNSAVYEGDSIAALQEAAYPDLEPLVLAVPQERAFALALEAAEDEGWEIVEAAESQGRIEATDTTFWFGFEDDVVIRVTPLQGGSSRIDVRSVSRAGGSDVGTNAARIRDYLDALRDAAS